MDKEFKIKHLIAVPILFNIQVNSYLKETPLLTLPSYKRQEKSNTKDRISLVKPSIKKISSASKLDVKVDLDPSLIEFLFNIIDELKLSLETKQASIDMLEYLLNHHLVIIKDNLSLAIMTIILVCSKVGKVNFI